mgnify:FL=1
MEKLIVQGKNSLKGEVKISGAKNAALPIMAACLLIEGRCCLKNIPQLTDIKVMIKVLEELGAKVQTEENELMIDASRLMQEKAPAELVSKLRASVLVLGPLLARRRKAKVALPGGCNIGLRPVDLHLRGLSQMGASIRIKDGYIEATANPSLVGGNIYLDFPSVGATENLLLAACFAKGTTIIKNASRTPEVVDLCSFLQKTGVNIKGAGTDTLIVKGKSYLFPANHVIISDRIEAGTFMMAAGITGGEILLKGANFEHLEAPILELKNMGMQIEKMDGKILVKGCFPLKPVQIKTLPHPGFPTDLQPQLTSLACLAKGESRIVETIFESRFSHIPELKKMGAKIEQEKTTIKIKGVPFLKGSQVTAFDIRGGAALVLAGLAATGQTHILNPQHIDRGYQRFEEKLAGLGANIKRVRFD